LGNPAAPTYLLRCDDFERWLALRWTNLRNQVASAPRITTVNQAQTQPAVSPARKRVGRPKGTGYRGDPALVKEAEERLSRGEFDSVLKAAEAVAGDRKGPRYLTNVHRLRKKIKDTRAGK
jgi:hypothetical protein